MTRYGPLERLTPDHDTSEFDCGSEAQTNWLRKHALQAQAAETAAVYVVCTAGSRRVVGYFALAAGSVERSQAPERVTKRTGRYPIPIILLARLSVDVREQGHGLGRALMKQVLLRTSEAADNVGARALLIHAESDAARSFYEHLAEFEPSPTDALHLFLLMKDLRATIDGRPDPTSWPTIRMPSTTSAYDEAMSLTAKLHPDRFTAMSPKMTAIIAYVLGEEWTDPQIGWMSVSSDGYATNRF